MAASTLNPVRIAEFLRHDFVEVRIQPPTVGAGGQGVVLKVWDAKLSRPSCAGAVG